MRQRDDGESRPLSTNQGTDVFRAAHATSHDLLYRVNSVLLALMRRTRGHYNKPFMPSPSTERERQMRITKEASDTGIPIAWLFKINTQCQKRPHQGVILEAVADVPMIMDAQGRKGVWVAVY